MSDGMMIVQTFSNEIEGAMAQAKLRALGVAAWLKTDNCGGMRPHMELQEGVHLWVAETELAQARDILTTTEGAAEPPAWVCPQCGEGIDAGFDTCWQCGHQSG